MVIVKIYGKSYKCGNNPVNRIKIGKFLYTYYNKYYVSDSIDNIHGRFKQLFKIIDICDVGESILLERGSKMFSLDTMKSSYVSHNLVPIKAEIILR